MFQYEINQIQNPEIKTLLVKALECAPKATWSRAASSTFKYHPLNEKGGIETVYEHTKRVAAMVRLLTSNECLNGGLEENPLTQDEKDILLAAAVLHDSCKYGLENPETEKYTKFEHPILVANLLPSDNGGYWDRIVETVSSHSGMWNTSKYSEVVLPTPKNRIGVLLHEADWLVSQRNIQYYQYNARKPRTLFSRLREAIVGWWTERKINKGSRKKS